MSNQDIYEILYNEFSKGNVSADLTVPFFFSFINTIEKVNKNNLKVINELQTEVNRFKELQDTPRIVENDTPVEQNQDSAPE